MGIIRKEEKGKKKTLSDDLIEEAGGCAVVDGGFATQLELHGTSIKDCLLEGRKETASRRSEGTTRLDGAILLLYAPPCPSSPTLPLPQPPAHHHHSPFLFRPSSHSRTHNHHPNRNSLLSFSRNSHLSCFAYYYTSYGVGFVRLIYVLELGFLILRNEGIGLLARRESNQNGLLLYGWWCWWWWRVEGVLATGKRKWVVGLWIIIVVSIGLVKIEIVFDNGGWRRWWW